MTTASPKDCNGNASGNGNSILSPTLNWKSNNMPEKEEDSLGTWFVRGAVVGAGIAVSLAAADMLKNWWLGTDAKDKADIEDGLRETQKVVS